MATFKWWHQDPQEMKVWEKLNALSKEDRESKYKDLCDEMVRKYGNIYFFKPHEQQEPVLRDVHIVVNVHGQNSGGKSYAVGAKTAYNIIGWSPYETVPSPQFGTRVVWIITTTYQIQTNSSQTILFSNPDAPLKDIGLLPPIPMLEAQGAKVVWEKGEKAGILKSITMPDGTKIEFRSMESGSFSLAGAAVDLVWIDEICPQDVYNELVTRVLRKNGRVLMSYLVGGKPINKKIPGAWVVDELYPQHERKVSESGYDDMSFHFFIVEKNTALDPEQVKKIRELTTPEERAWRFSAGGKFNIKVDGRRVWGNYKGETHLYEGLLDNKLDEFDILYRVWDLGSRRPCCTMFQIDKYNRVKIFSTVLGDNEILHEFIPRIQRHIQVLFSGIGGFYELLPHDAKRRDGNSPKSAEMVFRDYGCRNLEVIYVHVEEAIRAGNTYLGRLIGGVPAVQVDPLHAALMGSCLELYTRDPDSGDPIKDKYYEHVSDNFKLIMQFLLNNGVIKEVNAPMIMPSDKPGYLPTSEPIYKE